MAFVGDFKISTENTATLTHTADLPSHEIGDLLVWMISKDGSGGGPLSVPTGWTKLGSDNTGGSIITSVMYKIAAASEANPATTVSATETFASVVLVVKGFDSGDIINGFSQDDNSSGTRNQFPALTTDEDDCLLIYFAAGDGSRGTVIDTTNEFVTVLHSENFSSIDMAFGTSFLESQGSCPRPHTFKPRSDGDSMFVIAINTDAAEDREPYVDPFQTPTKIGHPIVGIFDPNDIWDSTNTTGDASVIGTLDGTSVVASNNAFNRDNGGVYIFHYGINNQVLSGQLDDWSSMHYAFTSPRDFSVGVGAIHISSVVSTYVTNLYSSSENGGTAIALADSNDNWRAWAIGSKDSKPKQTGYIVSVFDLSDTYELDSSGTLDLTDITKIILLNRASSNSEMLFSMFVLSTDLFLLGGCADKPCNFETAFLSGKFANLLIQNQNDQVENQFLSFKPIVIGNGPSEKVYFDANSSSLEFGIRKDFDKGRMQYQVDEDYSRLEINASSGSTVKLSSCSISSGSGWKFYINPSSSSSATYFFENVQIINAEVELNDLGYSVSGLTFSGCKEIQANDIDLSGGCSINNSKDPSAIVITSQADLDNLANCDFTGNNVAIEVDIAGSVSLSADNIRFSGNTSDILYKGTGTLTWLNSNGSDASVSSVDNGGTVVIESPTFLNINVSWRNGSQPANYEWRLYVDDPTPGIIGTTELDGAENETSSTLQYQYNYSSDQTAVLQIIADGFIEPSPQTIVLSNSDQTINVTLVADPNL